MSERGKFTYDPEKKALVPIEKPKRLDVDAPYVKGDEIIDGIVSMADCKTYYSKSAYERSIREQGFQIVGNEKLEPKRIERPKEREDLKAALRQTYYSMRDNMNPDVTEYDRERSKIIKRNKERYNYDRREYDQFGNPRD